MLQHKTALQFKRLITNKLVIKKIFFVVKTAFSPHIWGEILLPPPGRGCPGTPRKVGRTSASECLAALVGAAQSKSIKARQRSAATLPERHVAATFRGPRSPAVRLLRNAPACEKGGVLCGAGRSPLRAASFEPLEDIHRTGARAYSRRTAQARNYLYQGRVAGNSVSRGQLIGSLGSSIAGGLSGVGGAISGGTSSYVGIKTAQKNGII